MRHSPSPDSAISVIQDGAELVISIPQRRASPVRYFGVVFLLCWLVVWVLAFLSAFKELLAGDSSLFLVVWLAGWTVGGFFAFSMVVRMLRPSVPETLRLRPNSLDYDAGLPPFNTRMPSSQKEILRSLFPKRTIIEVNRQQLGSLRLRETDTGNRLTLDIGPSRLSLAEAASEIEREWLFGLLSERYRLTGG